MLYGPVSPLPRALVDSNGLPYKGSESNAFPPGWDPDIIILEGMFTIQINSSHPYHELHDRLCSVLTGQVC